MKNRNTVTLLKDLPNLPKGRIFATNINGDYYSLISNEEHIQGDLKTYQFTKEEVKNNPEWFSKTEIKMI